jgi:hypothetical protein
MSDPWDAPPFPTRGDDADDTTYAAVGRFISAWEEAEVALSLVHAALVKRPFDAEAIWGYGDERIFRDRLKALNNVAAGFFCGRPDQALEGDFKALSDKACGFAARRNEVAHGIVRPIQWYDHAFGPDRIRQTDSPDNYCLVPAHYTHRKFEREPYRPKYAYTSVELLSLEKGIRTLTGDAMGFREKVFPAPQPSPAIPGGRRTRRGSGS